MNLYFLVEGRRTEMAVYPAWMKYLLPEYIRVETMEEVVDNHYILMSGFGYPNLLFHIGNAVADIQRSGKISYLIICVDSDDQNVKKRENEIFYYMKSQELETNGFVSKVIVQKRCIESWFLGNKSLKKEGKGTIFEEYFSHYDVFHKDPEEMKKPDDYKGSIGNYHTSYLCALFRIHNMFYSKKHPYAVCREEYLRELVHRAETSCDLGTLRHFLKLCKKIKEETR